MFGIGGGELIFILFIILMLFGSDKVPEIARTMGRAMAQIKNATNDIKSEIQKGVESNGFDSKSLTDFTRNITSEIDETKQSIVGNFTKFEEEINQTSTTFLSENTSDFKQVTEEVAEDITDSLGAIKRKK